MESPRQSADDLSLRDLLARVPVRESLLGLVVAFLLLSRLLWVIFVGIPWQTGGAAYLAYRAQKGVDAGQVVYRDFAFEYPPIAWWVTAMPRWIDTNSYPDYRVPVETARQFRNWYFLFFYIEMFAADLVCFGLLMAIGRRFSGRAEWLLPAAYTAITISQPHYMYDTFDVGLLMFVLLSIGCWLNSLDNSRAAERWGIASYLFLSLGISFKVMPIFFVPFLLLADWRFHGVRKLAPRILLLVAAAAGPFLLHARSAGWAVLHMFKYHGERGINTESTWGGLMLALRFAGIECESVNSHVAFDLVSPWSGWLKVVASVTQLLSIAALMVWAIWRGARFDRRLALDTAILSLLNVAVLSNVYSTY
ncbi:MAG TPA: hypothetical protein VGG30_10955, partial [Pirellulales bacterium]